MFVQFIKEDCLLTLKKNLPDLWESFTKEDSSWIEEYFNKFGEKPFVDTKYPLKDFKLDMSADKNKASFTELENVKRVYGNLAFLSDSVASDERLWVSLCLKQFWTYVQYRWNIISPNSVRDHFFFGHSARRSLTRNAIARLWWIGRLTYDSQNKNPFELTEFVCKYSDFIFHVFERNTSNNLFVIRPFLRAALDAQNAGYNINTDRMGDLAKYLNLLGGTYILDCLPEQVIYEKIFKKACKIANKN